MFATPTKVKNAGLVLVNTYTVLLFDRLGLLKDKTFIDKTCQRSAVHYLQYVATGLSKTQEAFLPLNKVLCGLAIHDAIPSGIEISKEQQEIITGLLDAMIGHWPDIGTTSINGFRGNWLVRDGILTEHEDKWELIVEKRAYDILLNRSPFSFSIIKHPWMIKPLHVNWPY